MTRLYFASLLALVALASCKGDLVPVAPPGGDGGAEGSTVPPVDGGGGPEGSVAPGDDAAPESASSAPSCPRNPAPPARPAEYPWAAAVGPDQRIYVAMGDINRPVDVAAYDLAANMWTPLPPLPVPAPTSFGVAAAATPTTVYFMADLGNDPFLPTLYAYDPASNAWKARAPFQLEIGDASVSLGGRAELVAVGRKLYVTGGETTGLYEYDEATDGWAVLPFPPVTFDGNAAVATDDGRIVVLGVHNAAYDVATQTWKTVPDELVPRYGGIGVFAGGRVYTFGGYCTSAYPACGNEDDVLDVSTDGWSTGSRLPFGVTNGGAGVAACDGRIYVFGGDAGTQRFDPAAQSWDWSD